MNFLETLEGVFRLPLPLSKKGGEVTISRRNFLKYSLAIVGAVVSAGFMTACREDTEGKKKTPTTTPESSFQTIDKGCWSPTDCTVRGLLGQTNPSTGEKFPCPSLSQLKAAGLGTDDKGCASKICCGYPPNQ